VIRKPYLLFLGDAQDQLAAKTAAGVAHWRPEWCVGQFRLPGCRADLGLDDITLDHGRQLGAATLARIMHDTTFFYRPCELTRAEVPSGGIGVRQLAVRRVRG
jgi:hypothetical protein